MHHHLFNKNRNIHQIWLMNLRVYLKTYLSSINNTSQSRLFKTLFFTKTRKPKHNKNKRISNQKIMHINSNSHHHNFLLIFQTLLFNKTYFLRCLVNPKQMHHQEISSRIIPPIITSNKKRTWEISKKPLIYHQLRTLRKWWRKRYR